MKDWGNTKGELIGCIPAPPHCHRQRGRWQGARARWQGAISALETGILHQTVCRLPVANHTFLGSWMVDICQEGHGLRWAPRNRHMAHLRVLSRRTRETKWPELGRRLRCMVHLGQGACQALVSLSCSDMGKGQNTSPTKSVPLRSTRGPEPEQLRPWKCTKCWACFGQCPCRATCSLSSVDPESACHHKIGQIQCGPFTGNTPHTCQRYLFTVSIPPHNTAEQVSLNKWQPSPPCVRAEIRHWRDLQTEEAKINKREPL